MPAPVVAYDDVPWPFQPRDLIRARCPGSLSGSRPDGPGLSSSLAGPGLARAQRPGCWRTRDGCLVQLLVNVDENGVVFDLACVNRDGAAGKHADGLARGQVVA